MKNLNPKVLVACTLAMVLTGCATTGNNSYTALNDGSHLEQMPTSPTEDMNELEKAGYYLGWISLAGVYCWAGGSASLSAP